MQESLDLPETGGAGDSMPLDMSAGNPAVGVLNTEPSLQAFSR